MRKCTKCFIEKDSFDFAKDKYRKDGLKTWCKKCTNDHYSIYYKNNRNKMVEKSVRINAIKYHTDKQFRLNHLFSTRLRLSVFYNEKGRCFSLVNFTKDEFIKHFENNFQPGMTWENYGEWHIDHIIPKTSFKFSSYKSKQFKACWSLSNLRPLWAKDNFKKGNK